jgi:hypothetical protein
VQDVYQRPYDVQLPVVCLDETSKELRDTPRGSLPQERRQAMPQSVRGHAELDPRSPRGLGDHPLHIAGARVRDGFD